MSYQVDLDEVRSAVATLPTDALAPLQATLAFLELTPWAGPPWQGGNPSGAVRFVSFGEGRGTLVYLILEEQQVVDVLTIFWL